MTLRMVMNVVLILMLGLFLGAPKAYASAALKKPKVGIFVFRLDDLYIKLVTEAAEKYLEHKADLIVFDAKQDQVLQINQLASFVASGGDAVLLNLVDVKIGQNVTDTISKHDIPLIFFNKQPSVDIINSYEHARYVGSKASQSGVLQGEIIAKLWANNPELDRNDDGVCNFLMLQGNIDNPEALARSRISVQRARALGVNMQQIGDTLICDWDAQCAYNATKLAFGLYADQVDFIIANNDGMALGAIELLQEQGFNLGGEQKVIPVVGIDGIDKAKEAIKNNMMHGTVIQDADAMGKAIATMALNAVAKKHLLDGLPHTWDENERSISIPYRAYEVE